MDFALGFWDEKRRLKFCNMNIIGSKKVTFSMSMTWHHQILTNQSEVGLETLKPRRSEENVDTAKISIFIQGKPIQIALRLSEASFIFLEEPTIYKYWKFLKRFFFNNNNALFQKSQRQKFQPFMLHTTHNHRPAVHVRVGLLNFERAAAKPEWFGQFCPSECCQCTKNSCSAFVAEPQFQ